MISVEKFREELDLLDEIGLKRNEKEIIIQRKLREFLNEAVSVPQNFVMSFPSYYFEKIGAEVHTYEEYLSIQRKQELSQCQEIKLPEKVVYIEHNNKRMPLAYKEPVPLFRQLKRKTVNRYELFKYMFWNNLVQRYGTWYEISDRNLKNIKENFPEFWERLLDENKNLFEAYDRVDQQKAEIEEKYNMMLLKLSEEERNKLVLIIYQGRFIEITD